MTKRELFNAIVANEVTEEVIEAAKAELEKMDAANEKRKTNPTGKAKANAELNATVKDAIFEVLTNVPTLVADIKAALAEREIDVTPQRINALARILVDEGKVAATKVKVPTKGEQRAYNKI